jgi:hypothetical protein
LARRDGLSAEIGLYLWLTYTRGAFRHTAGEARLLLFFDRLLGRVDRELERMGSFLCVAERAAQTEVHQAAAAFLDGKLRHHYPCTDVADARSAPQEDAWRLAREIYSTLASSEEPDEGELDCSFTWALEAIRPAVRHLKQEEHRAWRQRIDGAVRDIEHTIPAGDALIIVDDNQWLLDSSVLGRPCFPFVEQEGLYWGPPSNDEHAIQELRRLQRRGAKFIAFAAPAFPWLTYYPGLHRHLRARFRSVLENDRMMIFALE